jgi:hypothetical protein
MLTDDDWAEIHKEYTAWWAKQAPLGPDWHVIRQLVDARLRAKADQPK